MKLKVWCWRPRNGKFRNFGDELGPLILSKLGYDVQRVSLGRADIIACGTILDQAAEKAKAGLIVWGAGAAWDRPRLGRVEVIAVRGQLTARTLGVDVPLGDPGILVSRLWPKPSTRYKVGVVPHYVDKRDYSWADIVIDVKGDPEEVIRQIGSCEVIASSSLHGLIVAQSYGIPAMRITHNDVISGDYKWLDYATSLDRPVEQVQEELLKALEDSLGVK